VVATILTIFLRQPFRRFIPPLPPLSSLSLPPLERRPPEIQLGIKQIAEIRVLYSSLDVLSLNNQILSKNVRNDLV